MVIITVVRTLIEQSIESRSTKYYHPSASVVDGLEKELHYLSDRPPQNERLDNTMSKRKRDLMDRVFQALVDVVYFLEYIEDHPELHDSFDAVLKDLLGVSEDNSNPRPFHYKNRGNSLFSRFLISSIFGHYPYTDGVQRYSMHDFRLLLIDNMIGIAISSLQFRLGVSREAKLFGDSSRNTKLWSELIASRYKPKKERVTHRSIGYSVSIPFTPDRMEYEAKERKKEAEKKAQENLS